MNETPDDSAMKQLRLAVRCPKCRRRPDLRIVPDERERYERDAPTKPVGTIQCRCGEVVELTAGDFQKAA